MAKPNSYGICLYKIDNKKIFIFVNKTSNKSDLNFFKGKSEDNETIIETAIREMYEETNIMINKKQLEKFFIQKNKNKNIGIFLVDYNTINNFDNLKLEKKEIFSSEWLNIEKNMIFSKNQSILFQKIQTHLFKKFYYIKQVLV